MNTAGLIYDNSKHYLDHLAPFCSLLHLPLIICEPEIASLAHQYYPFLEIIEADLFSLSLPPQIISCETTPLLKASFPHLNQKNFWLPHGNSDKGWKNSFFEDSLQSNDSAFVYGQKMIDFMKAKEISPIIISVGNFRADYWKKNHLFYQSILEKEILSHLPKARHHFLYAPTWKDTEENCSFWNAFPFLSQNLPEDCNLLVKLHPNTILQFPIEIEILKHRLEMKKNILFIEDFPSIYPLLSLCDAYIGDMSSIGYDFLYFNKPMFFINPQKRDPQKDLGLYLYRCGIEIDPASFYFSLAIDSCKKIREDTYNYTFAPLPNWTKLSTELTL